ncbi:expressed unknown protein [Seminavis robusta]|uniref:Uncharacterized protein n=1 Tax=Seminavis robusta TaxID=568900 RepID=A0A9N8HUX2_9STRA|nr:expressed unknown protein [Seminavis robusta]|eukprot:Sro1709_g292710.1 n/a (210) ;mRNA; r:17733-18362
MIRLFQLLLALLIATAATAFDFDKCSACIGKGCWYCNRVGKTTSYESGACTCDLDAYRYGDICNDISMITSGETYGRQKYYYGNNNNNNNNNNGNNNANNYYYGNNNGGYGYEDEDSEHYNAWLSGGVDHQKVSNHFGCYLYGEPEKTTTAMYVVGGIIGATILGCLLHWYCVHREKPPRPYRKKKDLLLQVPPPVPKTAVATEPGCIL